MMKQLRSQYQTLAGVYLMYCILAVIILVPLYWIVTTSFKLPAQVFGFPPKWIPNPATFENYRTIFERTAIPRQILNSFIVGIGSVLVTITLSALAAYGFSRFEFKYKNVWYFTFIGFQLLPVTVNIVPYYFLAVKFQMVNSYSVLIIIFSALRIPIGTMILKGFFDSIPSSIEEAATIDGANRLQILSKVLLPISLPGLASASLLTIIFTWNQFLLPLILNSKPERSMATVGVFQLAGEESLSWHLISAGTMLSILPVLLIFVFTQNLFISGLSQGSGK